MANLRKYREKLQITLQEKSPSEFAIALLRETGNFNMLNKLANRAYKARTDWLNHFYSPWESEGYKEA